MTHRILVEYPFTPVICRILRSLAQKMARQGCIIYEFHRNESVSLDENAQALLATIHAQKIDFWLSVTDPFGLNFYFLKEANAFTFEQADCRLIFLHLDHLSYLYEYFYFRSHPQDLFEGSKFLFAQRLFQGLIKTKEDSIHFCLEKSNIVDLRRLGIRHAYKVNHWIEPLESISEQHSVLKDVTFVGHLLPATEIYFQHPWYGTQFWTRLYQFSHQIGSSIPSFLDPHQPTFDLVLKKMLFHAEIHSGYSFIFRGEVISRIESEFKIDIIGGDPSYLHGVNVQKKINRNNTVYHSPNHDPHEMNSIYRSSKINLNITSLQFDTAVINRVLDAVNAGGFVLTDFKEDLGEITSVAELVSYHTIEELNQKIDYYLGHDTERREITAQFRLDILANCSCSAIVTSMIEKMTALTSPSQPTLVKVDLGCGSNKLEGYIGVDVFPAPGVDIVADLNRSFPFEDGSVDVIRAVDAVEHWHDRLHTMNELWRICAPNAIVDIIVPSTDGRGAFQDPTHVSFWNINSFRYYCPAYPGYFNLCQQYGFIGSFAIISLGHSYSADTHSNVVHVHAKLKALKEHNQPITPKTYLAQQFPTQPINLILDLEDLPSEYLYSSLFSVLAAIDHHPQKHQIKLFIARYRSSISLEDLEECVQAAILEVLLATTPSLDSPSEPDPDLQPDSLDLQILDFLTEFEIGFLRSVFSYRVQPDPHLTPDPSQTEENGYFSTVPLCSIEEIPFLHRAG